MKLTTTLIRRTVVSLSAIAALTITGYAASQTAQTVQLVGSSTNSCTYSSMTVSPNGGVLVQCGGSSSGPGTFRATGPTSLAISGSTNVSITRTGGSSGAVDVSFTASGACSSPTASPVSFADADAASKTISVVAAATGGTCTVSVAPSAGTAGPDLSITVVDPNADVVFAFFSSTSQAQVGQAGATAITATRTGGTNGAWTVPVVLSGDLTSGALLPATGGTLSAAQFTFPANSSTATINYTPPGVMPAGSTLTLTMQSPVPSPTAPVPGQSGTLTPTVQLRANTLTLSGPSVGCPAYTGPTPQSLNTAGYVNHMKGAPPSYQVAYILPTNTTGFGILGFYSNTTTPAFGPTRTEVKISKCLGDFTDNADGCYQSSSALINQQFNQEWAPKYTARYPTPASFVTQKRCMVPLASGTWYVNVRMSYPSGACATNQCGWDPIWKNGSTL